jgi:hypothetical protein
VIERLLRCWGCGMRKGSAASVKDTRLGCYFGSVAFPIKRRPVGQRKPIPFDVKGLTKEILAETLKEHVRCRLLALTDVPIALAHVCFAGEGRKWRGLAAMSLSDP